LKQLRTKEIVRGEDFQWIATDEEKPGAWELFRNVVATGNVPGILEENSIVAKVWHAQVFCQISKTSYGSLVGDKRA